MHGSMLIEPCANGAELCEIIGELRKRKHEKEFITKILEKRDKQLFPRDLFVAYVPTKRGGLRAAGLLKRSLKFDARRGSHLCIDFVWVLSDFRRLGIGNSVSVNRKLRRQHGWSGWSTASSRSQKGEHKTSGTMTAKRRTDMHVKP